MIFYLLPNLPSFHFDPKYVFSNTPQSLPPLPHCRPSSPPNHPHARLNCDPQLRLRQNSSILTISWNKSSIIMRIEAQKTRFYLLWPSARHIVAQTLRKVPMIHLSSFKFAQTESVSFNITKVILNCVKLAVSSPTPVSSVKLLCNLISLCGC